MYECGARRPYKAHSRRLRGDPNPLVAGKGIKILREHGVEVTENVMREECDKLNEVFMHYITTGRPFNSDEIRDDDGRQNRMLYG